MSIKPIESVISPRMTLDQLIHQLQVVRETLGAGNHGVVISALGSEDNFTTTQIQVCGSELVIQGVDSPCISLAAMKEQKLPPIIDSVDFTRQTCDVCGGLAVVAINDYCVFERDGMAQCRAFSGGPYYYCEMHKRESEEVLPTQVDIEKFNEDSK